MAVRHVITLHNAVTVNSTSPAFDFGRLTDNAALLIVTTGAPTFSYQLQGSIDGVNFVSIGSAFTQANVGQNKITAFTTTGPCRFFRAVLTALSGGTFTAKLAALPGT